MLDKIGKLLAHQAPLIGELLLHVLNFANTISSSSPATKQIRRLAYARCFDFVAHFSGTDYTAESFNPSFYEFNREEAFAGLPQLYNKSDSSLLKILVLWSQDYP